MHITLVKPPEISRLNFGTFSLAVLAATVRDIAKIMILDLTDLDLITAVNKTLKTDPDLVGVTTMGLTSVKPVADFIRVLRRSQINATIVAGGHGATMTPRPLLEAGADTVVCEEGEITFRELVKKGVSNQIQGLALLHNGKMIKTAPRPLIQPLDCLSEPANDLTESSNNGIALLETSRGCPHACIFCESTRFYHNTWRARTSEVVTQDVQRLIKQGAIIIHVVDDNFTASPRRALQICELLQKTSLPLFFSFSARSDDLFKLPELIPALAKAHFLRANIGIETFEPELANFIKKPITFEIHHQAIKSMQKAGIFVVASFILGLPNESEKMRNRCVDQAIKVGVDSAQFIPFQPLPGTPFEKDSGEPEPWSVVAATQATQEFRRHHNVINRLLSVSKETTVRGMLARESLIQRIRDNILDSSDEKLIMREMKRIDPGFEYTFSKD